MHPTGPCPEQDPPRDRHHQATLYASLELSRSTWLVTSLAPGGGKMSKHSVAAGDGAALLALLARLRGRVERSAGGPVGVVVVQEAGRDGFWLHRLLEAEGVESHVVDPASVAVPRRQRRAKTDAIDGETLLRTLLAWRRGEPRVCAMVVPPTPGEEDRRRTSRERGTLLEERIRHTNRIKGLLAGAGGLRLRAAAAGPARAARGAGDRRRAAPARAPEGGAAARARAARAPAAADRRGRGGTRRRRRGRVGSGAVARRPARGPQGHRPADRGGPLPRGPLPQLRQPAGGGGLRRAGADALAQRQGRPRAGDLQGRQPAPAPRHGRAGLAVGAGTSPRARRAAGSGRAWARNAGGSAGWRSSPSPGACWSRSGATWRTARCRRVRC